MSGFKKGFLWGGAVAAHQFGMKEEKASASLM